jgi:hypothetical protein
MTAQEAAQVITPLAWPVTTFVLILVFRSPLTSLLSRLAESMSVKTLKLKVLGNEIEITPDKAKETLDELLQEIVQSTNELSPEQVRLLDSVRLANGRQSVADLLPAFIREGPDHIDLRVLRDRKLLRPFEGGPWSLSKHPALTRFGELVIQLQSKHRKSSEQNG